MLTIFTVYVLTISCIHPTCKQKSRQFGGSFFNLDFLLDLEAFNDAGVLLKAFGRRIFAAKTEKHFESCIAALVEELKAQRFFAIGVAGFLDRENGG